MANIPWSRFDDGETLQDAKKDLAELVAMINAVQEQVGLKLDSVKGPVDVLVADPPSPNWAAFEPSGRRQRRALRA